MAFFPDQEIEADSDTSNESATGVGYQLAIIPPGDSQIKITSGRGVVMRVVSSFSPDLAAQSYNASSYITPPPTVAPTQAWPDPPQGVKLSAYPFSSQPSEAGRASCRSIVFQ